MSSPLVNEKQAFTLPPPTSMQGEHCIHAEDDGHGRRKGRVARRLLHALILLPLSIFLLHKAGFVNMKVWTPCQGHKDADPLVDLFANHDAECTVHSAWQPLPDLPFVFPPGRRNASGQAATFQIPPNQDIHIIVAGPTVHDGGSVEIDEDADLDQSGFSVRVHSISSKPQDPPTVRLCQLTQMQKDSGVALILEPTVNYHTDTQIHFAVSVPVNFTGHPISITTNTPRLFTFLRDVGRSGNIKNLKIMSTNAFVHSMFTRAENIHIQTDYQPITGSYETESHLDLTTSNAVIDVDLDLLDSGASVTMKTSNAPLKASVDLSAPDAEQGSFTVDGRTSNAPVSVTYHTSPGIVSLTSHLVTSNGRVDVGLPPAFEGSIYGKTSNHNPVIDYTGDISDPAGKDRHRSFERESLSGGTVRGRVSWDGDKHAQGSLSVVTTNAPMHISL